MLNLRTGKYHGLNPTAGRMLEVLERSPTVRAAADELAQEYDVEGVRIESDLLELCQGLLERGLIEIVDVEVVDAETP